MFLGGALARRSSVWPSPQQTVSGAGGPSYGQLVRVTPTLIYNIRKFEEYIYSQK